LAARVDKTVMKLHGAAPRSASRLFAVYALTSLVPVLVLGLVLAGGDRRDANARGVTESRTEAELLARTAVAPIFSGQVLHAGLTPAESAALHRMSRSAIASGQIVRLRIRNLNGTVLFATDDVGLHDAADADALEAARGHASAEITHLNADDNPTGPQGQRVAEVYWPLSAGAPAHRIGVLELYLPYAPIARDVGAGLGALYRDLGIGLAVLYLLLGCISFSVTRRLRAQVARNAHLAEHDALTGLPNRALFHRRVIDAIAAADRGVGVTVAVIDLDRFKEVNDTLGHGNGDALLRELGRRLGDAVRGNDTVARLGGDEFGVVLTGVREPHDVLMTLLRLLELMQEEVDVRGLPLAADASIGFAMAPEDGTDVDTLLQHADVAMYVAKGGPSPVVRYDPGHDHYDSGKLALVAELRRAITNDELVLHYQPKAKVPTGEIIAVEALVRWNHPDRGLLYPDAFLPIAEQTGIIDSLTRWVLYTALTQVVSWGDEVGDLSVAVNISARNVSRGDFAEIVLTALAATNVPAHRLLLEITETAFVADPDRAGRSLRQLAAAGVRISLDDFGRGQTSLGYLSTLPLHEVKIDKSFVADMLHERSHAAIVRSVIDLAHNLGFEVVAEGVETEAILAELTVLGCDIVQGYLLARPMSAALFPDWLLAHQPRIFTAPV
jgi:diguanylate cyclase (GGDEF)-like protein